MEGDAKDAAGSGADSAERNDLEKKLQGFAGADFDEADFDEGGEGGSGGGGGTNTERPTETVGPRQN